VARHAAFPTKALAEGPESAMEFYSFRFIDMKVAQADTATPKVMAVEIGLGFKAPGQHTVEAIKLTVHVPHDPDKTVSAAEKEAYALAQKLLTAAAEHCATRDIQELCDETEKNKAFFVKPG
jgi:hypothetical protein